jgi:hypothetical protein
MEDFIVTKILKFIGRKLNGYKTIIGGVGFILTGVLGMIRIMFPDQTQFPDMTFQAAAGSISAGVTAIGMGHKVVKMTDAAQQQTNAIVAAGSSDSGNQNQNQNPLLDHTTGGSQ